VLHVLGGWLGRFAARIDKRYGARLAQNASQAGFTSSQFTSDSAAHMGRSVLELSHIWTWRIDALLPKVKVTGWENVQKIRDSGQGVLMLTPHIGAFELLSLWIGLRAPFTAMYRPPKQTMIAQAMLDGRQKYQVKMASADIKGIRTMLRALKNGELVGLLPDQVPNAQGDAVLVDVFGAPAWTMTLPSKLLRQTGAALVVMSAKRVSKPHRYEIDFQVVDFMPSLDMAADATRVNELMELIIRRAPEQYLWGYNRYKGVAEEIKKEETR
jgi:KDO2-lipid IV(A) lauroyltransferase